MSAKRAVHHVSDSGSWMGSFILLPANLGTSLAGISLASMLAMAPTDLATDPFARLRIALTYFWRHRRMPNYANPSLFTELVQLRKLRDRDLRMPAMADKVAVKSFVGAQLGREWVIPMLWSGVELPRHSRWKSPVVVKSRHGCNQNVFVGEGRSDWTAASSASTKWMKQVYGQLLDEWLYAHIPRGLLIEPCIGSGRDLPIDYKIYVFGGRATHVQVHLDRGRNHRWIVHDTNWRAIANGAPQIPRPTALPAMIEAAETLAQGFDFARVDFYQPNQQPLFGEICFYPGSGLDPFDPPELDMTLGRLWLEAASSRLSACSKWSTQNAAFRA
jgi:hypothetical protein